MAKKPPKEPKRIDREKAAAVVRAVELVSVQMTDCVSRQNFQDGKLPDHIVNNNHAEIAVDKERTGLRVRFKCSLLGTYGEPKGGEQPSDKSPFFVGATFQLFYAIKSGAPLDDQHLGAFAQQTGLFNVWPYWRELAQSLTTRMGLPPLTLPLLKMGTSDDAQKDDGQMADKKAAKRRR